MSDERYAIERPQRVALNERVRTALRQLQGDLSSAIDGDNATIENCHAAVVALEAAVSAAETALSVGRPD